MAVSQVRALINGVWTVLTYNSSTGKYEATIAAPAITSYNVNAGHHYPVVVEATDQASNVTTATDAHATLGPSLKLLVKEVTKPTITVTAPAAGAYLASNTPPISFQLRDEVNGSGIKISSLTFKIDSQANLVSTSPGMSVVAVGSGYDITYTPQTALSDGDHTILINVDDNDGNGATQVSRTFKVDTVPPVLNITTPTESTTYKNVAAFTVVGTTNDAISSPVTVTIKRNGTDVGAVTVDGSGNFSKAITLTTGTNTIVVRATDLAGKFSEVTRTIILDTTAPVVTAITITPNPVNVGQSFLIAVSVTDA